MMPRATSKKSLNLTAVEEKLSLATKRAVLNDTKGGDADAGEFRREQATAPRTFGPEDTVGEGRAFASQSRAHVGEPFLQALIRHDQELIELDSQIGNLQRALKELKKAREDQVAAMRGTIRDAARPLFQAMSAESLEPLEDPNHEGLPGGSDEFHVRP